MKRDGRLQPLSRDHHEGLVLARALRWAVRGDDRAPRDPLALLRRAWRETLDSHFREEEEQLLPWMDAGQGDRLRRDHARLRELSRELLERGVDDDGLAAFARELHEHIRWEERVLFPQLERDVPRSALDAMGRRLAAVEATRTRACFPDGGNATSVIERESGAGPRRYPGDLERGEGQSGSSVEG